MKHECNEVDDNIYVLYEAECLSLRFSLSLYDESDCLRKELNSNICCNGQLSVISLFVVMNPTGWGLSVDNSLGKEGANPMALVLTCGQA
jgi:hypothetical protein